MSEDRADAGEVARTTARPAHPIGDRHRRNALGGALGANTPITGAVFDGVADDILIQRAQTPRVRRRVRRRQINRYRRLYPKLIVAVPLGLLSTALYIVLFAFQDQVLALSTVRPWSYILPVSIALTFSFVHGAFTGAFWDAVGLRPNVVRR